MKNVSKFISGITKNVLFIFSVSILFFSCNSNTKNRELLEIPVDIDQNISLPLSEITEELTSIELELTDESLINPDMNIRVISFENNIFVAESNKILVFNREGKFVRSIGSRGQGPGEYNFIMSMALDERNERLFIISSGPWKILCYDFSGKILKELSANSILGYAVDINYVNDEILVIDNKVGGNVEEGILSSSILFRFSNEFKVIDSCIIQKNFDKSFSSFNKTDFILKNGKSVIIYCSEQYREKFAPREIVLRDNLYRLEKSQLVPDLKLKFKNDGINGGNKFIDPHNIYRSSRYIFSIYDNYTKGNRYCFCYDTKTGTGYNMQDGYTDDINGIDKPVQIRPFNFDTEMFYYLHTHMKPDDLEEPNPTLYIGKLKK